MPKQAVGITVKELSSKPFIHRALQSPQHPTSVLSFFFGADFFESSPNTPDSVRDGSCIFEMKDLWFHGGDAYDALCQPFSETVRAAGARKLPSSEWDSSVDGLVAQLLLTDQLARNIFRGSDEAFAYEDVSLSLARQLTNQVLGNAAAAFSPPYLCFMVTALSHSEELSDHEDLCLPLIAYAKSTAESIRMKEWWDFQSGFEEEHAEVVRRFKRYPHRNKFKGRESTREELEWLDDDDNLPMWAKSMG